MTDEEICRSWRTARNRRKQIKVLAELTLKPPEVIRSILVANGCDPDARAPKCKTVQSTTAGTAHALPAEIRKEVFDNGYCRNRQRRSKRI